MMRRPSPITFCLAALVAVMAVVAVRLVSRPRAGAAGGDDDVSTPATSRQGTLAAGRDDTGARPSRPPSLPTTPPTLPVLAADVPEPRDPGAAAIKRRALGLAAEHNRLTQQADEDAFESLNLPEAARITLRKINEEVAEKRRDSLSGGPVDLTADQQLGRAEAIDKDATRIRRQAIIRLLGEDQAKIFAATEATALRRLQRR